MCPQLEMVHGLPQQKDLVSDRLPKLIIMDDLMAEIFRDPRMTTLFTQLSHHNSISIIFTTQNYFETGNSKTIVRNCTAKVIFNDPMDKVLIRNIAAGCSNSDFLFNCFSTLEHFFPEETHPYILIDGVSGKHMKRMMFRSHIFPDENNEIKPICFFVNPLCKK